MAEIINESDKSKLIGELEREEQRIRIYEIGAVLGGDHPGELVEAFEKWKNIRSIRAELTGDEETLRAMGIDYLGKDDPEEVASTIEAMERYISPVILREKLKTIESIDFPTNFSGPIAFSDKEREEMQGGQK